MNIEESLGGITAAGEHSIEIDGISHPLPAVIAGRPQGSVETVSLSAGSLKNRRRI